MTRVIGGMKDLRGDISQLQGGLGRTSADLKRQMLTAKSIQEDTANIPAALPFGRR